jgi:hypothetical protein
MIGIAMSVMMRSGSVSMARWNPSCPSPAWPHAVRPARRRPVAAGSYGYHACIDRAQSSGCRLQRELDDGADRDTRHPRDEVAIEIDLGVVSRGEEKGDDEVVARAQEPPHDAAMAPRTRWPHRVEEVQSLEAPAPHATVSGMMFGAMVEKFLAEKRAEGKRSIEDDEERSRPLLAFLGADTPLAAITTRRVAEYRMARLATSSRRGRPLAPATVNRECARPPRSRPPRRGSRGFWRVSARISAQRQHMNRYRTSRWRGEVC